MFNPLSINDKYTTAWENFPKSVNEELEKKKKFSLRSVLAISRGTQ